MVSVSEKEKLTPWKEKKKRKSCIEKHENEKKKIDQVSKEKSHHVSKRGKWKRVNDWCKWKRSMLSYP
jgi:hypothetical protein